MAEKSSVFDMIGPVMIGPSSSHTAGVVKIGKVTFRLLSGIPEKATITFYNSFARTYEGHGSDRAILAGLMGFDTDDKKIKNSFDYTEENGMIYAFKSVANANTFHPNTVKIEAERDGEKISVTGESRGGGVIKIVDVNGFSAGFTASLHTILIEADDKTGSIAYVSDVLSHDECNIATMTVSRKGKNDIACQILEMDSGIRPITIEYLKSLSWIKKVIYIPNID
ncbi:MAG: L-serine ammonia-lyase, iron-sulfur-dependent subunit beta [Bacteroidota bacterium]